MFDKGNEPQDIFAETESAKPAGMPPRPPAPPRSGTQSGIESGIAAGASASGPSKLIFAAIAVVVLGGIGVGAYFLFFRSASEQVVPAQEDVAVVEPEPQTETEVTPEPVPEPEPAVDEVPAETEPDATDPFFPGDQAAAPLDTDGDGLDDMREAQLGTNPSLADTDGDGLSDREEVDIYGTDPLNPDTDGDGFLDGEEVRGGYDPKGPGRLFEIPANGQ